MRSRVKLLVCSVEEMLFGLLGVFTDGIVRYTRAEQAFCLVKLADKDQPGRYYIECCRSESSNRHGIRESRAVG
jgi:hypothetical protein